MGFPIAGTGEVGVICKYIGVVLPSVVPGDPFIYVGNICNDPPHYEEPGEVSPPCGKRYHSTTP